MSDYVEWNPKRHGQQPPYWLPDMLTSVDGKNFVRQSSWAWIAGSTYYVPREAVGLPRIEPEPEQTDEQRIRAQVFQEIREAAVREVALPAIVDLKFALANWEKYDSDETCEITYQANKVTAAAKVLLDQIERTQKP